MSTASSRPTRFPASRLHRRPLAVCLAAILAVPVAAFSIAAPAATLTVTSCDDAGAGTLRDTVTAAVSGDTIDFSATLGCSQITLTSGAIAIGQGADSQPIVALDIVGPGRNALTIDGNYADRVFVHEGGDSGALTISGVTLKHGFTSGSGGCISAQGAVSLTDVQVAECAAGQVPSGRAPSGAGIRGGGVYAAGSATLTDSLIGDNKADGHASPAYGAGVFAGGDLTLVSTTISGNYATTDTAATYGGGVAIGNRSGRTQGTLSATESSIQNNTAFSHCGYCPVRGGGVWIYGSPTFEESTVSGNTAFSDAHYGAGGGLYFTSRYGGAAVTATLTDTNLGSNTADENGGAIAAGGDLSITRATISGNNALSGGAITVLGGDLTLVDSLLTGNIASDRGGGIFLFGYGDVAVQNSTISENMAANGGAIANTYGSVHLSNTTLTANTVSGNGGGIWFQIYGYALNLESTIVAGNSASDSPSDIFPPDQNVDGSHNLVVAAPGVGLPGDTISDDPLLLPLANNGGPTMTHALGEGSPAIDAGSDPLSLEYDQRGEGFIRVAGVAPDIGAFETQPSEPDRIFADGFDP